MKQTERKQNRGYGKFFYRKPTKPPGALDQIVEHHMVRNGQLFKCLFAGCDHQTTSELMAAVHVQHDHGSELITLQKMLPDLFFDIKTVSREISNRLHTKELQHESTTELAWVMELISKYAGQST